MRRFLLVVLAAVVVVAVGAAMADRAQAQKDPEPVPVVPPVCYIVAHDLNRDGKVNEADMKLWKDVVWLGGGECRNGAPASACPPGWDVNKDGTVTFADLNIMLERYRDCVMNPALVVVPR